MAREVNLRLTGVESGNASDFNEYVYIGSTCLGFIWRENLPEHHHDYRVTRRVWKQLHDQHTEYPTRAAAVRALIASLPDVIDYAEIDSHPPFKLERLSRDEREAVA